MIDLNIDFGNMPSVLAALSRPNVEQHIINAVAESYVDDMHDWIDEGRAFKNQTGHLQQSIGWHPNGNGKATVFTQAEYAQWVEEGTRPHVIKPKDGRKALKIPNGSVTSPVGPQLAGGGYVLRRAVHHPGTSPMPFFYTDNAARLERGKERALSVLMRYANG